MLKNNIFKMEIVLDRKLLEEQGYDWDTSYNILCKNFERLGFVKESFENGKLIYKGTGSNKDVSYFGIAYINLSKTEWFVKCVKWWYLLIPQLDGTYGYDDCIEASIRNGGKEFYYDCSQE